MAVYTGRIFLYEVSELFNTMTEHLNKYLKHGAHCGVCCTIGLFRTGKYPPKCVSFTVPKRPNENPRICDYVVLAHEEISFV